MRFKLISSALLVSVVALACSTISSTFRTSGPYDGSFGGTLRDPASIAATTDTGGTMPASPGASTGRMR